MDKVPFPLLDFRSGQPLAVGDFVMAVMAENDEIVILVVGSVTVDMMFRKNVNSLRAADGTGIIGFKVNPIFSLH